MAAAYIPLIETKIAIPPVRSQAVMRPRLLELLEEAVTRPLTLISAPAGVGKSTPGTNLPEPDGPPPHTAWFSLDADDSDPVHFVYYLTATLQKVEPRVGRAPISLLGSLKMPETNDLVSLLANEITAAGDPIVLVLDDYHMVNSEEVNSAVAFLVEHLPDRLRLLGSRRDRATPPLRRRGYRHPVV